MGKVWALSLAIVLTGCAQWHHPTATQADFNRDRYQCDIETAHAYPVAMTPLTPGYQAPTQVTCMNTGFGMTNCTSQPGVAVAPVMQDMNANPRISAFNSCMYARGYYRK